MKKILIAYYSWSGHTTGLAKQLQILTDADMYVIQVPAGTFSTDMNETSNIAKTQLQTGKLPPLTQPLPDLTNYEMILVGGPVWSGAPATPVLRFLAVLTNNHALLAPFYTHAGSASNYEAAFKRAAGKHPVAAGLGMPGYHRFSKFQIQQWLNQLQRSHHHE